MKQNVPVSKIMTKEVKTISESTKISRVKELLESTNYQHFPVVRGDKLIGMVSSSDILRVSFEDSFGQETKGANSVLDYLLDIGNIMTIDVQTISPEKSIKDAAQVFVNEKYHALPVVDDDHNLIGIITSTDIIKYLLEQY